MLFNLDFANNTVLSCFVFFCYYLFIIIINLCFLIPAVIAKISNHIAEVEIRIEISSKKAKAEIEMHAVTSTTKINKVFNIFSVAQIFEGFLLISSFCSNSSRKYFFFLLYFST